MYAVLTGCTRLHRRLQPRRGFKVLGAPGGETYRASMAASESERVATGQAPLIHHSWGSAQISHQHPTL